MVFAALNSVQVENMFKGGVLIFLWFINVTAYGQNALPQFIIFPGTMPSAWSSSLGLTFTTTPRAITEEEHISVPAIDFHVLNRARENFNLDAHAYIQVIQNHASIGFRWLHALSDKVNISAGDDVAGWIGWIKIENINTRGHGLLNYPNVSLGYKVDEELLVTLKAEVLLNFHQKFFAGEQEIEQNPQIYSGEAFTLALEQPFFKDTWVTLAFRAMYSNFFWQAWSLFENYDRNIFYPELTATFIL